MLATACVEAGDDIGIDDSPVTDEDSRELEVDCCSFLSTTVWPLFMARCIGPSCRRGRSGIQKAMDRRVQNSKKSPKFQPTSKTGNSETQDQSQKCHHQLEPQ